MEISNVLLSCLEMKAKDRIECLLQHPVHIYCTHSVYLVPSKFNPMSWIPSVE